MNSSQPSTSELSGDEAEQWKSACGAFRAYKPADQQKMGLGQLGTDVPIVMKFTKDLSQTYHHCNPSYYNADASNYKIYLTVPSVPASNGGLDNANKDLILAVNGVLINEERNHRYIIKGLLGHGTFGQVAKCWRDEKKDFVAVKVIKNHPAYGRQAIVEISILHLLNGHYDPDDTHHIVRIVEHFTYKDHLCIVFEMLGLNLYELLKANKLKGISLDLVHDFSKQILRALALLGDAGVIHCDLKPENILLTANECRPDLKVIDFGSACREDRTVYSYIQSRYYRSPEVVLGHQYTTAIDMWSFGCIAVELFLGLPLFPAESQYDLLQRMMKILGGRPPDHVLKSSKNTNKYFQQIRAPRLYSEHEEGHRSAYQFLTPEDYEKRKITIPGIGKHFFPEGWDLEKIIISYNLKKGISPKEIEEELQKRLVFMDFVKGLLIFDPSKRWTPQQAAQHPFVTRGPFTGQFKPPMEAPQMPIHHRMNVDHDPTSGHWLGASLSSPVNAMVSRFSSPHNYQYFTDGSSLGSGESYGSYGDGYMRHQLASTARNPAFGFSPDTRCTSRHVPPNHRLQQMHVDLSPSCKFRPSSLGASPTSHFYHSLGSTSTGSSGIWPSSPARSGGSGASSLGKVAVRGQFNKRRGLGGSGLSTVHVGNSGASLHPQTRTHNTESLCSSYIEDSSPLDSPRSLSDRGLYINTTNAAGLGPWLGQTESDRRPTYPTDFLEAFTSNTQLNHNSQDDTSPANWDPNFSEDLLLENEEAETWPRKIQTDSSSSGECILQGCGASIVENPSNSNSSNIGMLPYEPHFISCGNFPLVGGGVQAINDYERYLKLSYLMQQTPHIPPTGIGQQTKCIQQQQQQYHQYSGLNDHLYKPPAHLAPFLHFQRQTHGQGQTNVGLSRAFGPTWSVDHRTS